MKIATSNVAKSATLENGAPAARAFLFTFGESVCRASAEAWMVDCSRAAHLTLQPGVPTFPMTNKIAVRVSFLFITTLALVALFLPVESHAQDATARITGTISDSTGAVIPGVQVTVTNTATQVRREATSDRDGFYQVLALPIGGYRVAAVRQGFRTVVSDEYKLLINQALRVDIKMEVGS